MYASYIVRRTQIYIGDDQDRLLHERAKSLGTTKSAVIRDAIDSFLKRSDHDQAADLARLRAAVAEAAGIAPHLPGGAAYVDELRALDTERDRQLRERAAR
jgi:predicted transcriptional regulator